MDPETERLTPRVYLPPDYRLLTDAALRRVVVLLEPRRVGKTILIRRLTTALLRSGVAGTRIGYVELDHPLLHGHLTMTLVVAAKVVVRLTQCENSPGRDKNRFLREFQTDLQTPARSRIDVRALFWPVLDQLRIHT